MGLQRDVHEEMLQKLGLSRRNMKYERMEQLLQQLLRHAFKHDRGKHLQLD